jgi:hypothetical protein
MALYRARADELLPAVRDALLVKARSLPRYRGQRAKSLSFHPHPDSPSFYRGRTGCTGSGRRGIGPEMASVVNILGRSAAQLIARGFWERAKVRPRGAVHEHDLLHTPHAALKRGLDAVRITFTSRLTSYSNVPL